jgi:hypothetical protein
MGAIVPETSFMFDIDYFVGIVSGAKESNTRTVSLG